MKTRNCKLGLLVIFLALCLTIYAGNCYSQGLLTDNYWRLVPGIYDTLPVQLYDSMPLQFYEQYTWPISYLSWRDYQWPLYDFYYWQPSGITTLEFFQDKFPDLTYDRFYSNVDIPGIDNWYVDYSGFPGPVMDEWYLYKRADLYVRPKAGEQTLYEFTKNFLVQPRKPDIYTAYGMSGGLSMDFF